MNQAPKESETLIESSRIPRVINLKSLLGGGKPVHDDFCHLIRKIAKHPLEVRKVIKLARANLQLETPDLRAVAREPLFVPDTMSLSNFLRELQASRQHCAVVLDEHGTAIGRAFREDALEEIVGPRGDEFDEEEADFLEPADGVFEMRGRDFQPDQSTEVEVSFERVAEGTRVSVEHRGWAGLPADHPAFHGLDGGAFTDLMTVWWADLLSAGKAHSTRR